MFPDQSIEVPNCGFRRVGRRALLILAKQAVHFELCVFEWALKSH
jgi:hypothetical protein